ARTESATRSHREYASSYGAVRFCKPKLLPRSVANSDSKCSGLLVNGCRGYSTSSRFCCSDVDGSCDDDIIVWCAARIDSGDCSSAICNGERSTVLQWTGASVQNSRTCSFIDRTCSLVGRVGAVWFIRPADRLCDLCPHDVLCTHSWCGFCLSASIS